MPIAAHPIDPRDQTWEVDEPTYRVCFWSAEMASDEWELLGGDVDEALQWAHDSADGRTFTLHSVVKSPGEVGLLRLLGTDPTRA